MLTVSEDLVRIEDEEHLVSVKVVLSVTVTIETRGDFGMAKVGMLGEVAFLKPVEEGKVAAERPVTGAVKTSRPEVALKWLSITSLHCRERSVR